jgi:cell division septation protein DedD
VIQVSAFKTQQPAAEAVQRLRKAGYDAFLETPARGLYRVRIGRFKERTEAERVARRLEKEGTKSVISR